MALQRELIDSNIVVKPETITPDEEAVFLNVMRRTVARVREAAKILDCVRAAADAEAATLMDMNNPMPAAPAVAETPIAMSPTPVLPPDAVTEEDDNDSWGKAVSDAD